MSWGDAKKWLFEDICIYVSAIILSLAWDWLVNLAYATNLIENLSEPDGHPYGLGVIQVAVLVFCAVQLVRKLSAWRYY